MTDLSTTISEYRPENNLNLSSQNQRINSLNRFQFNEIDFESNKKGIPESRITKKLGSILQNPNTETIEANSSSNTLTQETSSENDQIHDLNLMCPDQIHMGDTIIKVLEIKDSEVCQSIVTRPETVEIIDFKNSDSTETCRVCLQTASHAEDYLVRVCQCNGSSKFIHLNCIRNWVLTNLKAINTLNTLQYYTFMNSKVLECEICKARYPWRINIQEKDFTLIPFKRPEGPYIILEKTDPNKTVSLIATRTLPKYFLLGTGNQANIRLYDKKCGVNQAKIEFINNKFILKNLNPNLPTILKSKYPRKFISKSKFQKKIEIESESSILVQKGKKSISKIKITTDR